MSGATGGRAELFGVPIDLLGIDDTVARCRELVESGLPAQHVVLNAGKVVMMRDVPGLREIVADCDVVNADGQSVVWAGRLLGVPVPERVAGIDLMDRLLAEAEERAWPVYFLGARREVLERFVEVARQRYPGIEVAGARDGYFDDDAAVCAAVRESGARLLFVGISSPRKEFLLREQRETLGPMLSMGVGGSFDVWAGLTSRAPGWMQKAGLEWFHRLMQEPGRMWRRYLVGNTRFVWLVAREMLRGRRGD